MYREDVTIPTDDKRWMPAYFVRPERSGKAPGILLIHEIFGMTPEIRAVADRMAERGYAVLVPDLYHRSPLKVICIARTMSALRRGQGDAFGDLETARKWLAERPSVDQAKLGVMGFCMGGGFAILVAARGPFEAASVWYGQVPQRIEDVSGICPVVASFGAKDAPLKGHGERLESFLTSLGVKHDVRTYPEVGHAFAFEHDVPAIIVAISDFTGMSTNYDAAVAADAWGRVDRFFAEQLGGSPPAAAPA